MKSVLNRLWKYIIRTSGLMALGLFSTLIVGVIVEQIGGLTTYQPIQEIGKTLQAFMGVGIGVAIAFGEKDKLQILHEAYDRSIFAEGAVQQCGIPAARLGSVLHYPQ